MAKKRPDPNRPRRWQAILRRIPTDREWIGAEVGVWMGRTAREVLSARPKLWWHMIDAWQAPDPNSRYAKSPDRIAKNEQPYFDDCYRKTVDAVSRYGDRAIILRQWSEDAVEEFADGSLDCVFIDAEHTYEGVKRDIGLWMPKVRSGGWIGGHDMDNLPRYPGVRKAVTEMFGDEFEIDGDCTWFHYL